MDCPRIGRQFPASRGGAFKRLGTDAAKMRMAAGSVVEDLDIVKNVGSGEVPGFVDAFSDALLLQAAEEGFRDGVVPAIGTPAHARLQIVGQAKPFEVVAAVLAALI